MPAEKAAYVGSSNELAGARDAGFRLVVLAEQALARYTMDGLPRPRAQADASVVSLPDVVTLVDNHPNGPG